MKLPPSTSNVRKTALAITVFVLVIAACGRPPATRETPTPIEPAVPAPAPPPSPKERWSVDKSENELDHTMKLALNDRELYLRCAPRFEGYITPELPDLGHRLDTEGGYHQTVRFRIDDGPLRSESWTISDDFEALFLPTKTLRQVVRGKKLIIEYKPDYVSRRTMTLDLSGLEEAARSAGCKL